MSATERPGQLRVRVRASKTNADGGREDHRLLVGGFAAAVDALRSAGERDDDEHVVPLSGRHVNRRLKALAELAGPRRRAAPDRSLRWEADT